MTPLPDPQPPAIPDHRPNISDLDPYTDARQIVFVLSCWDFPWDIERALEFALFRTYAIPSISRLLAKTGEFRRRTRKRYDDTELILAEIMTHGATHPRGAAALARMNEMHGRFNIANEDMLYVLSTFVFEPIRWLERFGWRPPTPSEKLAFFIYYRELGQRMGIQEIPETLEDFEQFNRNYETTHFQYAASNAEIGKATLDMMLGFYLPRWLYGMGRPVARSLMDPPLLAAMGYSPAPRWLQRTMIGVLRLRAVALRLLPKRRKPHLLTRVWRPTYPNGYKVEELGT